jgi:hypothetical protein
MRIDMPLVRLTRVHTRETSGAPDPITNIRFRPVAQAGGGQ